MSSTLDEHHRPAAPERLQEAMEWVRPARQVVRPPGVKSNGPAFLAEVSAKELAEWGCVTEAHARLLKSGHRMASPAVEKLVRLHLAGRVVPASWANARWSFDGSDGQERLHGPDGLSFTATEVLVIPFLQAALAAHRADVRQFREDAERAGDLRHAFDQLQAAFFQISRAMSEADRLLSMVKPASVVRVGSAEGN